jgi:hypothetical protein
MGDKFLVQACGLICNALCRIDAASQESMEAFFASRNIRMNEPDDLRYFTRPECSGAELDELLAFLKFSPSHSLRRALARSKESLLVASTAPQAAPTPPPPHATVVGFEVITQLKQPPQKACANTHTA